jgi:NAD(P)H dehydrogenase (quinone)
MRDRKLLITYFTGSGSTKRMAEEIGRGAERPGLAIEVKEVEECSLEDLAGADGIAVGSPTYFSNMAWQIKKLVDDSIALYSRNHQLEGKVLGCFASAGSGSDGVDCIKMLEVAFGHHHRMKTIPGIIRTDGEPDKQVSERCRTFGEQISRQIMD